MPTGSSPDRTAARERHGSSSLESGLLVVASFNLHWGYDGSGVPFDVAEVLAWLDADVCLLQEVWWPDHGCGPLRGSARAGLAVAEARLARATVDGGPRIVPSGQTGTGWWGLAVLSRVPIVFGRELPVGRVVRDPVARAALDVTVAAGSTQVRIVNAHLSFRPHHSWRQLGDLRATVGIGGPTIVGGDLNLWRFLVQARMRGWSGAVRGPTWPASRPNSQLDHLLVSPGIEVVSGAVAAIGGSDHLPIRAVLRLPPAASAHG